MNETPPIYSFCLLPPNMSCNRNIIFSNFIDPTMLISSHTRPGNNSSLSGILGYRSKNFCESAVVATMKRNIKVNLILNFLLSITGFLNKSPKFNYISSLRLVLSVCISVCPSIWLFICYNFLSFLK